MASATHTATCGGETTVHSEPAKMELRCHSFGWFSLYYLPMAAHLFNIAGVGLPATTIEKIRLLFL
ncbi:hypothetical protein [Photobacterium aquimaris]|uniref:hypothetical protein n=1 Tax=Photobacterium aquimaris TaxID=512643 RepID=UPI0011B0035E|nr:hypothetical protein [Photobacterium aquimaris]